MQWNLAALALAIGLGSSANAQSTSRRVQLVSAPASAAMRQAITALQGDYNVPIRDVSAALVDLNDDGIPELIVQIGGNSCGSHGCATNLYERGTGGWLKINEWLVTEIAVLPSRWRSEFHDLLLDRERRWVHTPQGYTLAR